MAQRVIVLEQLQDRGRGLECVHAHTMRRLSRAASSSRLRCSPSRCPREPRHRLVRETVAYASSQSPEDAPPEPKLRRELLLLCGSQFIVNSGFGIIIPTLPALSGELGLGATGVGVVLAVPSAVRAALALPMGRVVDARGRVPLMTLGASASASATG